MKLYMFDNEVDRVIAHDKEDAMKVWEEFVGRKWGDYDNEPEWEQLPDDKVVTLVLVDEKDTSPDLWPSSAEIGRWEHPAVSYTRPKVTATVRAWCEHIGQRSFFSSTEV